MEKWITTGSTISHGMALCMWLALCLYTFNVHYYTRSLARIPILRSTDRPTDLPSRLDRLRSRCVKTATSGTIQGLLKAGFWCLVLEVRFLGGFLGYIEKDTLDTRFLFQLI